MACVRRYLVLQLERQLLIPATEKEEKREGHILRGNVVFDSRGSGSIRAPESKGIFLAQDARDMKRAATRETA